MNEMVLVSKADLKEMIAEVLMHHFSSQAKPDPVAKEEYLSRQQVCDIMGISLPTVHSYIKQGTLKAYRFGHRVRFKKAEVLQSLKAIRIK